MPLWPAFLDALPYDYAFLSSPVVDPAFDGRRDPGVPRCDRQSASLPKVSG